MNKREYLRSQGFPVGERGRFTPAMLTALEKSGIDFEEPIDKLVPLEVSSIFDTVAFHIPQDKIVREARTLYGYDREGNKLGFVMCHACNLHMQSCECDMIQAPPKIIATKERDVRVGRESI